MKKQYEDFKYWQNRIGVWIIEYPSKHQGEIIANSEDQVKVIIDNIRAGFGISNA